MFSTANTPIRNTLTAVAATFVCSAGLLAALDSPAHAATRSRFVDTVERQLDAGSAPTNESGVATVAVRIDGKGHVVSADLVGSTGHKTLDRAALETAKSVAYPKGDSRTVAVVLTYGTASKPAKGDSAALVGRYMDAKGRALASQTVAPNAS